MLLAFEKKVTTCRGPVRQASAKRGRLPGVCYAPFGMFDFAS